MLPRARPLRVWASAILLSMMAEGVARASPNLIINGSFETGVGSYPQVIAGWSSRSGGSDLECVAGPAYGAPAPPEGSNFCEVEYNVLSPTSLPDWLEQTVTTTSGERYFVSTQATTRADTNTADRLVLEAAGTSLTTVTTTNTWAQYQASFVASAGSTVIRYVANGSSTGSTLPGDSVGTLIDDTQVQELTVSPATLSTNEDTGLTSTAFQTATNTGEATLTISLSVSHGTLTLLSTTGLTITTGSNGSASLAFTGSAAAINTAFAAGLRYTPTADYNGAASLTYTATAGAVSDTDTVPITVSPVADIVADSVTTTENTAITFNAITGTNGASADNFENVPSLTSLGAASHGAMTFSSLGSITYTPTAGYFGSDSFTYTVTSGGVTETSTVTVTIRAKPRLTLRKTSLGNVGSFTFTGNNGWSSQTITTVISGVAVSGVQQVLTSAAVATAITEAPATGYVLTSASCTGMGVGGTASFVGNTLTLNAAAVALDTNITCSFTNTKTPLLTLQKVTLDGAGGPFTFTQTNLASTPGPITTVAASTAAPAAPTAIDVSSLGTSITLTEIAASGFFFSTATCTDANSAITGNTGSIGTVAGTTLTIPAATVVAGADFRCTYTNQKGLPSLTVLKSANTTGPVSAGAVITYSYRVTNTGNVPVSAVTLSDTHNGAGTLTSIAHETLTTDVAPAGDSTDAVANDDSWSILGPGDSVTFNADYTVVQHDIDTLQ